MISVAIQGIKGSYSEEAVLKMLGDTADVLECRSFDDALSSLIKGTAIYAVLPLRNKIVGHIAAVTDLVRGANVRIVDEMDLAIDHKLLGCPGGSLERVTMVCSHIEAIRQCRRFLSAHPQITSVRAPDTASSVRSVMRSNNNKLAAIGSARAAELYGAKILGDNIADDKNNWTRFGLIERSGETNNA
jgi:chorismate mutase / prephenate dehydratase